MRPVANEHHHHHLPHLGWPASHTLDDTQALVGWWHSVSDQCQAVWHWASNGPIPECGMTSLRKRTSGHAGCGCDTKTPTGD
ncbi:hypothetical protein E2C01_074034 [Portunus trituberculatus]|uniref:Uncharacterized protein n=1 Tax=Portunus trituberculatus TaxID=210409 RepID=A0A5B7IBC2_PORTR|nr:hypothetical protein [Portunus trituberculatus]